MIDNNKMRMRDIIIINIYHTINLAEWRICGQKFSQKSSQ